jgi:hypothetical protein
LRIHRKPKKKYVELFEPQQGTKFVTLKFSPETACGVIFGVQPVSGTIAAEVSPIETEGQEGLLIFPPTAIKHVVLEQQEKNNVGLTWAGVGTGFSAVYGARLSTGEKWGVFGQ